MSSAVLTLPVGAKFATRTPIFDTTKQGAVSGKETRIARQSYPRYKWELDIDALRSSSAYSATEFQYLLGFFNKRLGSYDSFLYTDPDDNTIAGQALGIADGTKRTFQLIRSLGGFTEPVLSPNSVSAVYLAGVSIPAAGYSAPGVPALGSSAAGALGATTYYCKITWNTFSGETLPGAEVSLAVSANHVLTVAQPSSPPTGVVGWNIYLSNTAGGGSGAEKFQVNLPIATTTWTEPTSGLISGAALPVANTTGWSISAWGSSLPGSIVFGQNVTSTITVSADFTYYWPCRFQNDSYDFALSYNQLYKLKKLSWISLKN